MSVWVLVAAMLMVLMQAGFILMETGSTRVKNAGNVVMKNLVGLTIGSVAFVLLGYGLLHAASLAGGLIGAPAWSLALPASELNWGEFTYQLAACAIAASVVSGATAERIRFSGYCIFVAVFAALIYPILSAWAWNGQGWLCRLGFIDFAGACVVHGAGGAAALVAAWMLGARGGKYERDSAGRVESVNAIPGQSVTMGAVGCLILWFGWYGFNGARAADLEELTRIFGMTTLSTGFASVTAMLFNWIKFGKPDIHMSLNGLLAGLVAISAGGACVSAGGAAILGIAAGLLVCFGIWFVDNVLHVDDPIGAVGVHGVCGIAGVLGVGLFDETDGLFYGGGFRLLGVQLIGVAAIMVFAAAATALVFWVLRRLNLLRVNQDAEIEGLDSTEHGLIASYGDFAPVISNTFAPTEVPLVKMVDAEEAEQKPATAAPAVREKPAAGIPSVDGLKYTKVTILCNASRFEALKAELSSIGVTGMTVTQVVGCGVQRGKTEFYRGIPVNMNLLPKLQVDIVVSTVPPEQVVEAAKRALYTGKVGDGKVFLYDVENVVRIRTGEMGAAALTGPEEEELKKHRQE